MPVNLPCLTDPYAIWRHDWGALSTEATRQLWIRKDSYPAMVAAGRMAEEEAAEDIAAWAAIAADWEWIDGGEGEPASTASLPARIAALDLALGRIAARIDKDGARPELIERRIKLELMREWAGREASGPFNTTARWMASVGHAWRQQAGLPTLHTMILARTGPTKEEAA